MLCCSQSRDYHICSTQTACCIFSDEKETESHSYVYRVLTGEHSEWLRLGEVPTSGEYTERKGMAMTRFMRVNLARL